jgi:hypothetical protein
VAYNFGEKEARGKLSIDGASAEKSEMKIGPGGREEQLIKSDGSSNVTVRLDFGEAGCAIVSARVEQPN